MDVREGDRVASGQPLFHDKARPSIKVCSPASGLVKAVVRGERRKILRIEVEVDGSVSTTHDTTGVFADASKAKSLLLESGLWAMMNQRPYAIVPDTEAAIRDIFISGFDSAPLAVAPCELSDAGKEQMKAGIRLLGLLTKRESLSLPPPLSTLPDA